MDVTLVVNVAPEIVGAEELQQWITSDGREALAQTPIEAPHQGELRLTIGGALYDYEVTLTALRDDGPVGEAQRWECECSNGELLQRVRVEIPKVLGRLEVIPEPSPPEPAEQTLPPPVAVEAPRKSRGRKLNLGPAGTAGAILMGVGAVGIAAGIPLIVLKESPRSIPTDHLRFDYRVTPLRPGGIVAVCVGGGLLVTGAVLFALRERIGRQRESAMVLPSVGRNGRVGVSVSRRF